MHLKARRGNQFSTEVEALKDLNMLLQPAGAKVSFCGQRHLCHFHRSQINSTMKLPGIIVAWHPAISLIEIAALQHLRATSSQPGCHVGIQVDVERGHL